MLPAGVDDEGPSGPVERARPRGSCLGGRGRGVGRGIVGDEGGAFGPPAPPPPMLVK